MAEVARTSKSKKPNLHLNQQIVIVLVVILVGLLWAFIHFVYNNPMNVFNGMISDNLKTSSFTKKEVQSQNGQTYSQYTTIQTGAQNVVNSISIVDLNPTGTDQVRTQSIGTPTTDYSRYTMIKTGQTNSKGRPVNYSSAIGIWGVNVPGSKNQTNGQLFNESVLGIVPIATLSESQHTSLLSMIKNKHIYEISGKVKKRSVNGRLQYTYTVNVNTRAYIEMIKQFGGDLGFNQLGAINPKNYSATDSSYSMVVDVASRQLVSTEQVGSNALEYYSAFGVKENVSIPKKTVPIAQLESKLQTIAD